MRITLAVGGGSRLYVDAIVEDAPEIVKKMVAHVTVALLEPPSWRPADPHPREATASLLFRLVDLASYTYQHHIQPELIHTLAYYSPENVRQHYMPWQWYMLTSNRIRSTPTSKRPSCAIDLESIVLGREY